MEWVKVVHIVGVIAWMAGLLYLPRLFVYHVAAEKGSVQSEAFKVMEQKLLRFIMTPAMIVVWITGLWLAYGSFGFRGGWLHTKILLVVLMSGAHGAMSRWRRDFATDSNVRSDRFYRIANEVPTVLMIVIVILVIIKPF